MVESDGVPYDALDLLACVVDQDLLNQYKSDYGHPLVTAYATIDGHAVGIVANQHQSSRSKKHGIQLGGVIYGDSADKASRFIMDCNQTQLPIIFFQDVQGFMVGRDAEQSGIIRSGAKLVNVVSNVTVPKITIIIGGSFGAGNYALCGKAFDPCFVFAWPGARYAVMGAAQAAGTLLDLEQRHAQVLSNEDCQRLRQTIEDEYQRQTDIRYGAARGWVDAVIAPHMTREVLIQSICWVTRKPPGAGLRTGVLQV